MERVELKLPLESKMIERCIPHRYPFLLVDKVIALEPKKMVKAIKNVSLSDPILQGHFPHQPVFPGVLLIEGMAQASAVLAYFSKPEGFTDILLTEVSQARFRRMIIPGDTLIFEVIIDRIRGNFGWFHGEASIDNEVVATCKFSALVR